MNTDTQIKQATKSHAAFWAIVGLVMWVIYGQLCGAGRWLSAGLAGFAFATVIVAAQYRRDAVKIMDCTSLGYFALEIALVLLTGDRLMPRIHLPFVWGVFAIVAWITIARRVPFATQYSREQAPPAIWENSTFYRMNLNVSVVWALIFTISALLGAITIYVGRILLIGIIIPTAGLAFGFLFSNRYPKRFANQFAAEIALAGARGLNLDPTMQGAVGSQ